MAHWGLRQGRVVPRACTAAAAAAAAAEVACTAPFAAPAAAPCDRDWQLYRPLRPHVEETWARSGWKLYLNNCCCCCYCCFVGCCAAPCVGLIAGAKLCQANAYHF